MKVLSAIILLTLGVGLFLFLYENKSDSVNESDVVSNADVKIKTPVRAKTATVYNIQPIHQDFQALKAEAPNLPVSSDMAKVLGYGPIKDYAYRYKISKRLHNNLSKAELREIFKYLSLNTTPEGDDVAEEAIRNDLLEVLINQKAMPVALGAFMLSNLKDSEVSYVWKDYLVQHFLPYLQRAFVEKAPRQVVLDDWGALPSQDQELQLFLEAYQEIASEITIAYSGTALIGLHRLAQETHLLEKEFVEETCKSILIKPELDHLAKASTLQILRSYDQDAAVEIATDTLGSKSYKNDALIASCLNIYISGRAILENDPIISEYSTHPLFRQVIKRNLSK